MDDGIAKIKQYPARFYSAFMMERGNPSFFECPFNFLLNSPHLPLAFGTQDNKVVGKATDSLAVKQDDILGLLIGRCLYHFAGYVYRFQKPNTPPW